MKHMLTTIIRIIITLTFIELNVGIYLGIKKGVGLLTEIRDDAREAASKADKALKDATAAKEQADDAQNIAEAQLRVRGELRNGPRIEE